MTSTAMDGRDPAHLRQCTLRQIRHPGLALLACSGFDMELNASGFKLHTQALSTVVLGALPSATAMKSVSRRPRRRRICAGEDKSAAMKEPDVPQTALLYFDQSLRGLQPAPPWASAAWCWVVKHRGGIRQGAANSACRC
jgi:hypothetical protein